MANLVKFKEIIDWDENGAIKYSPVYVDIDKIQYICPHADNDPKHCTITLEGSWTVGLAVGMDHLAAMVLRKERKNDILEGNCGADVHCTAVD